MIVLEPIRYFVQPATIVICKHTPDVGDSTCHFLDIHRQAQRQCCSEWHDLIERAVLSEELLDVLWQDHSFEDRCVLVKLMVKFGLIVPLQSPMLNDSNIPNNQTAKTSSYIKLNAVEDSFWGSVFSSCPIVTFLHPSS